MLIDTHCHLAEFARRGDVPGALDRAAAAGITRVITIGTGPDDWDLYAGLAAVHPGRVDYSIGLHPCDVPDDDDSWRESVAKIKSYFERPAAAGPRPVALGEIGLDRFHLPKEPAAAAAAFARQEGAFRAQLALARALARPIVIHSRDAFADCVRVIDESGVDWRHVVFHCFTHGPDELRTLRARGGRASFTGVITYKNAAPMRAALIAQGLEVLMLETDAPYLAPVPHRGQPNEPAFLAHTAQEAARLLHVPVAEIAARTTANAREFFGLR
jgi:TatD DNase family protein